MSRDFGVQNNDFERSRDLREQRLAEMMDQVIYPDNIGREGLCVDKPWASTVGEAVNYSFDESDVTDNLKNMDRVGGGVDLMLRERHVADIAMYARTRMTIHNGGYQNMGMSEIAGYSFDEEFMDTRAFGYNWYRQCTFAPQVGKFVLLRPMMQPWMVGGSPFPRVYASPDTDTDVVNSVVSELCMM